MPTLTVLVGMIASGKSTLADKWAERGAIVVCDDSIVEAVHAGSYTRYRKILKPLYKSIELAIATNALLLGHDVVIDRGVNISERSRRRWVGLAHSLDVDCVAVIVDITQTPSEYGERRFRNNARGLTKEYWTKVAEAHLEKWEYPITKEGFSNVRFAKYPFEEE